MDVLKFLSICYKAIEGEGGNSLIYEGASCRESFKGIIIESYYGIFCNNITTRYGEFHVGCLSQNHRPDEYIKSRITYKMIIPMKECRKTGCIGPFYLVTHIDGEPIEHGPVDGITFETYGNYIQQNTGYPSEFAAFIEHCMKRGLIKDTGGYIDKFLANSETYEEMVAELLVGLDYPQYKNFKRYNELYHLFTLLHEKKILEF